MKTIVIMNKLFERRRRRMIIRLLNNNDYYYSTTKKTESTTTKSTTNNNKFNSILIDKYGQLPRSKHEIENILDITKTKRKLQNLDSIIIAALHNHDDENDNDNKTRTMIIECESNINNNSTNVIKSDRDIQDAFRLNNLARAFRNRGHLVAKLDPLGRNLGQVIRGSEIDAKTKTSIPSDGVDLAKLIEDFDKDTLRDETTGRKLNLNEYLGLSDKNEDREFFVGEDLSTFDKANNGKLRWKATDILKRLRRTYSDTLTVEYTHLTSANKKSWLRKRFEPEQATEISKEQKIKIMKRLTVADGFEEYLAEAFPSAKRFGLEGAEGVVPGLIALVERAADQKCECIVLGMAHRGRLNVLSNIFQKPFGAIVSELKDDKESFMVGDVRYHLGLKSSVEVPMRDLTDFEEEKEEDGNSIMRRRKENKTTKKMNVHPRTIRLEILPNPSHLEMVNAVVTGVARGKQFKISPHTNGHGDDARNKVIPLIIHGDASFSGLGQNSEVMTLQTLFDYTTGGTIHVIINNQIGFTTLPRRSRTSPHPSDVSKGFNTPIFHVNADDPEAIKNVMEIAIDYRQRFNTDVVVDIVCYRRFGHNELDDPSVTIPVTQKLIEKRPKVSEIYAKKLIEEGVINSEDVLSWKKKVLNELKKQSKDEMSFAKNTSNWVQSVFRDYSAVSSGGGGVLGAEAKNITTGTGISKRKLHFILENLSKVRDENDESLGKFSLHPRIKKLLEYRKKALDGKSGIDWALAEHVAFSSFVLSGKHVRLSGQDCERGTFNQRHSVIFCSETGRGVNKINEMVASIDDDENVHLCDEILAENNSNNHTGESPSLDKKNAAWFIAANSPLSEHAVLGFEYGFSVESENAAVTIWEAQFGDFANNAQVIIDQFLVSGEERWGQQSNLIMLLPHGYEGQGPDHSTARIERWLQMANDDGDSLPGSSSFDRALMDEIFKAVSIDAENNSISDSQTEKVVDLHVLKQTMLTSDDGKSANNINQESDEEKTSTTSFGLFSDIKAYFGDRKVVTRKEWDRFAKRLARASATSRANFLLLQPTTPAQYFHALRRQALMNNSNRKPLIIITPKYLLHHRRCQSLLEDFDERSSFRRVICDGDAGDELFNDGVNDDRIAQKRGDEIRRVLLCSGKIWYDLSRYRSAQKIDDVILVRLEQLFPFPYDALARRLVRFPNAKLCWVQEEPKNMGAWSYIKDRVRTTERASSGGGEWTRDISYIGRSPSASPATGSQSVHLKEADEIIQAAFN